MQTLLTALLALVFAFAADAAKQLPSSIPLCKVSLPKAEYSTCLNAAVQKAFHVLSIKGIPSVGVFPVEPLRVSEISIAEGGGAVRLQLTLSEAELQGFNSTRLISSSNDISEGGSTLRAEVVIPRLEIISQYEIDGHVLLLPIRGKGDSNITLGNVNVVVKIENDVETRAGEEYFKVKTFKINIKPQKINVDFGNLFDGDPVLGAHMNRFLNENAADVFGELRNSIEEAFAEILSQITKRIFDNVPYKSIFLH